MDRSIMFEESINEALALNQPGCLVFVVAALNGVAHLIGLPAKAPQFIAEQ